MADIHQEIKFLSSDYRGKIYISNEIWIINQNTKVSQVNCLMRNFYLKPFS